jgi:hypothetical protein
MVQEKFVRYSTVIMEKAELNKSLEIAKSFLADGDSPERVAKNTGLSLAKVKVLLKPGKIKQRM